MMTTVSISVLNIKKTQLENMFKAKRENYLMLISCIVNGDYQEDYIELVYIQFKTE